MEKKFPKLFLMFWCYRKLLKWVQEQMRVIGWSTIALTLELSLFCKDKDPTRWTQQDMMTNQKN